MWNDFLKKINSKVAELKDSGCDIPLFRGHRSQDWSLMPGLGRRSPEDYKKQQVEKLLYYDFLSYAGPNLEGKESTWNVLFAMQHHGLPTRILDWTETFSIALYFAINDFLHLKDLPKDVPDYDPAIWILDPFKLNNHSMGEACILNPETDIEHEYQGYFIDENHKLYADVIAISPIKYNPRILAQRGSFTLHRSIDKPLEELRPSCVKKFVLPKECIPDAIDFLELAGVHEYMLFPDLDGLARHLTHLHVDWKKGQWKEDISKVIHNKSMQPTADASAD